MTPYGHAGTQYPQPLQMSSCTTTVPNSVRNSDPVGHTSRQPAWVQCLHTLDIISQRKSVRSASSAEPGSVEPGMPRKTGGSTGCSMNATCRHEFADRPPVLSYEWPSR